VQSTSTGQYTEQLHRLPLDRHRALDRVDDAGEFREKGVVQTVDDAPAEASDRGLAQEAALTLLIGT
jgi:hypothetical protein